MVKEYSQLERTGGHHNSRPHHRPRLRLLHNKTYSLDIMELLQAVKIVEGDIESSLQEHKDAW